MATVSVELNATREAVEQPIIWRLGKLFNVVTNIRRARVTEDYGYVSLEIEGSTQEVTQATDYLRALGLLKDGVTPTSPPTDEKPERAIRASSTIQARLQTVSDEQGHTPLLYRVGKDYPVLVQIERAAFDEEEGGMVEISISGDLIDVQRAIAYLHTTGLSVSALQRSVTTLQNL